MDTASLPAPLSEYHRFAVDLARQAGQLIRESFTTRTADFAKAVQNKDNNTAGTSRFSCLFSFRGTGTGTRRGIVDC